MSRNLIHMVSVDGSYQHSQVTDIAARTWSTWADKNGCDFVVDTVADPRFKNPIWNKWLMYERYPDYDKYCSVDCDTMIRWDAPNFFDECGDELCAVNDMSSLRWIGQSIRDRQKWFTGVKLEYDTYWNSGVLWLNQSHSGAFDDMIELYLANKEEFDTWTKGGGVVQTLLNFMVAKRGYAVKLIPPIWNLLSMHKTEMFSHNWQDGDDKTPFFIKYAYVWHFTGFPIEQRLDVMQKTWQAIKSNYEQEYV